MGVGTFGRVYLAIDIENKENYAIKIQKKLPDKRKLLLLQKETEIVRDLSNEEGFPKLKIFFKENKRGFLVMSYLGDNLSNLFHYNQGRFSLKTVCMVALQILTRIETLHSKFYIHRDIKLENITIGPDNNYKTLYLIDFGLSKSYLDEDGNHLKMRTDKGMVGTVRYSSIYTQQGIEQSRRDDLISIGYLLVYLLKEELPWQKVKIDYNNIRDKEEKYKNILKIKLETTNEFLCENLPKQFLSYMNYVKTLEFEQNPDYKFLKGLFQETLVKFNYENDLEFDWRKFYKTSNIPLRKSVHLEDRKINSKEKIQKLIKSNLSCENIQCENEPEKKKSKYQDTSRNTCNYAHWSNSNSNIDIKMMKTNSITMSPHCILGAGPKNVFIFNPKNTQSLKTITGKPKGIDLNARKIFNAIAGLEKYKKVIQGSMGNTFNCFNF